MRRLPRPERPRRRFADGIDAGWRLSVSFGLLKASIIFSLYFQLSQHETGYAIALAVCAVPFAVSHVFAWLTLLAWLDERSWLRAQRMAREQDEARERGSTDSD